MRIASTLVVLPNLMVHCLPACTLVPSEKALECQACCQDTLHHLQGQICRDQMDTLCTFVTCLGWLKDAVLAPHRQLVESLA